MPLLLYLIQGTRFMPQAIVIDTEVNNLDDREAISVAWMEWGATGTAPQTFEAFYEPLNPIEPGAMAVHHIIPSDLVGCAPSGTFSVPWDVEYIIGHNVDFDYEVVGSPEGVKRICTLAISRRLMPFAKAHNLTALMYYFALRRLGESTDSLYEIRATREAMFHAHSASADVRSCASLLRDHLIPLAESMYGKPIRSTETLWKFSEWCRVPVYMPFGKYRPRDKETATPIAKLPVDYLTWLDTGASDIDPYLKRAVRQALYG